MAKLHTEYKVILIYDEVDGHGYCHLREPSSEEWNTYNKERFNIKKRGRITENNDIVAKVNLFNKICIKLENIKDQNDKEVSDLSLIHPRLKAEAIFRKFEDKSEVDDDEKN